MRLKPRSPWVKRMAETNLANNTFTLNYTIIAGRERDGRPRHHGLPLPATRDHIIGS